MYEALIKISQERCFANNPNRLLSSIQTWLFNSAPCGGQFAGGRMSLNKVCSNRCHDHALPDGGITLFW
jgi:hypothetical protein